MADIRQIFLMDVCFYIRLSETGLFLTDKKTGVIHMLNSNTDKTIRTTGGKGLEFHNEQPIYIQIATLIKQQIASGQLLPKEKLPSVREYSVLFEVSALTIQRTMQYLEQEQVIYSKKGVGNFVQEETAGSLQRKMAQVQAAEFVRKMRNCGLTDREIQRLVENELQKGVDEDGK